MHGSLHKVSGACWEVDARAKQTRAVSNYALPQFVIAQSCERMGRTADLEGADFLQVLALEEQIDLGAVFAGCERGECFGSEDGGSVDAGLDELERLDDRGAGERERGRGHCRSGRVYRWCAYMYPTAGSPAHFGRLFYSRARVYSVARAEQRLVRLKGAIGRYTNHHSSGCKAGNRGSLAAVCSTGSSQQVHGRPGASIDVISGSRMFWAGRSCPPG